MEARLLYTSPEAVALGPLDLRTCARAFQPPKHKPTHILTPPPYLACFWSPWSEDSLILAFAVVRGRPNSEPNSQTLSRIQDYTNPTLGQFIFMHLIQHLQMSWTSFSKPDSPNSAVDSAPVVRIRNQKTLEPDLGHVVTFSAYLGDKGCHFSWCCLKKPVLELLAHSGNNRSDQCIPPHGVSKEISFGMSAFVISIMVWFMKSRPISASLQARNPAKP